MSTTTTSVSSRTSLVDVVPRRHRPVNVHQVDRQLDVTAHNTGAARVAGHVTNRRRLLVPAYIVGQYSELDTLGEPSRLAHRREAARISDRCEGYKNSSGDEIANVNFYAVRPGSYPNSLK